MVFPYGRSRVQSWVSSRTVRDSEMSGVPLKKLGYLARRNLAAVLDRVSPRGADWRGLADRMGFKYGTVRSLRLKESPTLALLDEWENAKGINASLGYIRYLV